MKSFKKLLGVVSFALVVSVLANPRSAHAAKYYVALTTVPVNASVAEYTSVYPNITGNAYVRKIVISNSTSTVTQTISIFDTCTSTTAATLKFRTYSGAASQATPAVQVFDFLPQSFRLSSPCFQKSGTTSTVDLTVFYE